MIGRPRNAVTIIWPEIVQRLGYNTEKEMITELYNNSKNLVEAAKIIGVSSTTLGERINFYGIPMRKKGGAHPKHLGSYQRKYKVETKIKTKKCLKCGQVKEMDEGFHICPECHYSNTVHYRQYAEEALYI